MSLRSVNLNLLPILSSLLHERNVSRAAAAVGMSQPAASRALAQLRAILGDPLLVPTGHGLDRTARADALIDTVDRLCRELDAFWQPESFDPALLKREFVLASSDYAPTIMVPRLSPRLLAEAPGISMRFTDLVPAPIITVPRGVDFVIVPKIALDGHLASGGSMAPLFYDEFVPVVATKHPLAGQLSSPEEIDSYPHVLFSVGENIGMIGDSVEILSGRRPAKILALVRHFGALPHLVLSTDAVAVMPRRLAEMMIGDGMGIVVLEEPQPRATVHLCLAWTARFDGDASHRWFRELVIDALAESSN
jgi:LysR family transcriptional regulator, nod-box dependent transcriptional activator